jgi:K+/H+ antiporter YhaU regulatory subunit KhtT
MICPKFFSKFLDHGANLEKIFSSFFPEISGFRISDIYMYEKNNHFRKSIAEAH